MEQTYTVKSGDTLYGISNQFGVSVTELAELNGIKGSLLQVGTVLQIPNTSGENPDAMFMYTVKSGDTLYSIARKYNTTADKIIAINYLKNTNLQVGQVLRIPETYTKEEEMVMPNYTSYTVKKGDSLYKIATSFNTTVDQIIKDNGLSTNNLSIGQSLKIRIPNDSIIEECYGDEYIPVNEENNIYQTYTVKKGDSLYIIANKYNTSVDNIKRLNNLVSNNLSIGQILKIPMSSSNQSNTTTYVVKKGDNLYSIAKKFNTTINSIKSKNNLKTNTLSIGQTLMI